MAIGVRFIGVFLPCILARMPVENPTAAPPVRMALHPRSVYNP
jgi:hypothetical protein